MCQTMWREYSEDVLMNVTVNDHTNSSNRAIASRSMSLKSLVDSLEVVRDKRQPAIRRREEVLVQRVCNHELNGMQLTLI